MNLPHVPGPRRLPKAVTQQRQHFTIGTATLALILVENHPIEGPAENLRLLANVLVTPVTGAADDD